MPTSLKLELAHSSRVLGAVRIALERAVAFLIDLDFDCQMAGGALSCAGATGVSSQLNEPLGVHYWLYSNCELTSMPASKAVHNTTQLPQLVLQCSLLRAYDYSYRGRPLPAL